MEETKGSDNMRLVTIVNISDGSELRYMYDILNLPVFANHHQVYVDAADCFYENMVLCDVDKGECVTNLVWYYCDEEALLECDKALDN